MSGESLADAFRRVQAERQAQTRRRARSWAWSVAMMYRAHAKRTGSANSWAQARVHLELLRAL